MNLAHLVFNKLFLPEVHVQGQTHWLLPQLIQGSHDWNSIHNIISNDGGVIEKE